jgi:tetratricopeptide (TPR) repeat protein
LPYIATLIRTEPVGCEDRERGVVRVRLGRWISVVVPLVILAVGTVLAIRYIGHTSAWLALAVSIVAVALLSVSEFIRGFGSRRPTVSSTRHRTLIPQELPARIGAIVGRHEEVKNIMAIAMKRRSLPQIIAITGEAGVGKTTLAGVVAERLARWYPNGQLYVSLPGRDARDVIADMYEALKGPHDPLEDSPAAWHKLCRKIAFVAVFDDATDAETVRSLLPPAGRCVFLVVSDTVLTGLEPSATVTLQPLSMGDAVELMSVLGATERIAKDRPSAERIAEITRGVPLAVCLTGAAIASRPQWSLASILRRAEQLPRDGGEEPDSLDVCYAVMALHQRTALLLLALYADRRFSPWQLQALQQLGEADAWHATERLAYAGLVDRATEDSAGVAVFSIPEHVRRYAVKRARHDLTEQERLTAERSLDEARDARADQDAARTLREKVYSPLESGQILDALNGARDVLALTRTRIEELKKKPPSPGVVEDLNTAARDEGLALVALAEIQGELGSIQESSELALQALRIDDRSVEARALRCMGTLQMMLSSFTDAEKTLKRALGQAELIADQPEQVRILRRLAIVQAQLKSELALESIGRAQSLCDRRTHAERLQVGVLWAAAVVRTARGELDTAELLLDSAEEQAIRTRSRLWIGWIYLQRAKLWMETKDYALARLSAVEGAEAFADMLHRYGVAHCGMVAGQALLQMNRPREAQVLLEEALSTFATCGDLAANAQAAIALAQVQHVLGDSGKARDHLEMAMRSLESSGDRQGRSVAARIRRSFGPWYPMNPKDETALVPLSVGPGQ